MDLGGAAAGRRGDAANVYEKGMKSGISNFAAGLPSSVWSRNTARRTLVGKGDARLRGIMNLGNRLHSRERERTYRSIRSLCTCVLHYASRALHFPSSSFRALPRLRFIREYKLLSRARSLCFSCPFSAFPFSFFFLSLSFDYGVPFDWKTINTCKDLLADLILLRH